MKKLGLLLVILAILAVLLFLVFPGKIILPQYFDIGFLRIHYYGLIMAGAVSAAYLLARKRAAGFGIEPETADNLIFWTITGGFLGARLYHVLSAIGYYNQHPWDIFKVWNGGLSIYGAVLGGILTLWVCQKIQNLIPSSDGTTLSNDRVKSKILNLLDWLAPSVLLGQIIGRFGNLFNYEAFGYPTNLPWKMFVPADFRTGELASQQFFHPLFLYEALGNMIILFFLLYASRARSLKIESQSTGASARDFAGQPNFYQNNKIFSKSGSPAQTLSNFDRFRINDIKQDAVFIAQKVSAGKLFFLYLFLYNMLRFFLEFMRVDSVFVGNFRLNVISSFALAILAAAALLVIASREPAKPSIGRTRTQYDQTP